MNQRMNHRVLKLGIVSAGLLSILPTPLTAQEPDKANGEPVRSELEALQKEAAARTPANRLKAAE